MTTPVLETTRLILRPWSLDDIDALHRLWNTPDMRRYLWHGEVITREKASEAVERSIAAAGRHGVSLWCLLRKPEGGLAGFCGFRFIDDETDIELIYGISPEYQGQGLATEAARATLRYGFETGLFTKVYARTDVANRASIRVLDRLGMKFVRETHAGTLPTFIYSLERR